MKITDQGTKCMLNEFLRNVNLKQIVGNFHLSVYVWTLLIDCVYRVLAKNLLCV